MRWLTPFPAKRYRRKIWTIGFDHELPEGNLGGDLAHVRAVLKRDDAGEGNKMVEVENFVRLFERAAEAMKDSAQFSSVRLQDFECVLPGVALVNNHV